MNIIQQNHEKINGVLEFFDRMIINGYLQPLHSHRLFLYYLIQSGVKLVDFADFAYKQTAILWKHIDNYVESNGVKLQYLNSGKINKCELAQKEFAKDTSKSGLVAAFSVVELCNTTTVVKNRETKKLEVTTQKRKCKHYYLYYNDSKFGWMFVKIQTWFPYNIQVYINGREYLSKEFDKIGLKYEMYNNSFSYIEDFEKAQRVADSLLNKDWTGSLDFFANQINCFLPSITEIMGHSYYWCIDQCEFATDINFKNRDDLSTVFKTLVETAFFTFSSQDIYSFFGRKIDQIHKLKKGEIVSDLRRRSQGFRIKFKFNKNHIKMYDKGNNLRVEMTINEPKDFKILKDVETVENGKIIETKKWTPMGKSIINLYRYAEISKAVNKRYINNLPSVDSDKLPLKEVTEISERKEVNGRTYSGFNIMSGDTLRLLETISRGGFILRGFDNKSIRKMIFADSESKKNIGKTTRLLAKLRVHGLVKKVQKGNRYYLTKLGRRITDSLLLYTNTRLLKSA